MEILDELTNITGVHFREYSKEKRFRTLFAIDNLKNDLTNFKNLSPMESYIISE